MDKVYKDAKHVHVAAIKVYAKSGDTFAYSDSGTTTKITAAELEDMYYHGCVIVGIDGFIYKPVKLDVQETYVELTYVKADGTTATTAVLATIKAAV